MKVLQRNPGVLLAVVLLLITAALFGPILLHPASYLFDSTGDVVKSYFCTLFYISNDHGLHFSGMNYPFGENLLYADAQPALSATLHFLHHRLGMPSENAVGVINSLIILSLPVAGVFVYFLLRDFRLPGLYAVGAAVVITFMSPQIYRFNAHLALSYVFFVPVTWWLILRIFKNRSWIWLLGHVLFALLMGCLHAYFLAIGALFLLAFALVFAVQHRNALKAQLPFLVAAVLTALTPLVVFNGVTSAVDHITDRTTDPYGFFDYFATVSSVFNPVEGWRQMNGLTSPHWEGFAYVGLVSLCVVLVLLSRLFRKAKRRRQTQGWRGVPKAFHLALPALLRTSFWAAVLILLFSFCLPFKIDGFRWIPELISPLKQFRALGRFAWIFYYVLSVYSAYFLYQLYRFLAMKGMRELGLTLLSMAFLIWGFEAYATVSAKAEVLKEQRKTHELLQEPGNYRELLAKTGVTADQFQAIIPLPYFHIGSEKLWIPGSPQSHYQSMKAALDTRLSVAATLLSRTSLAQTLQMAQLVGNPALPRPLLAALPSKKPFLLLVTPDSLRANEAAIIQKATKLIETPEVTLYALPVAELSATTAQEIRDFEIRRPQLHQLPNGLLSTTNRTDIFVSGYEDLSGNPSFLNKGSIHAAKGPLTLFDSQLPNATVGTLYEVSFWLYLPGGIGPLYIAQYSPENQLLSEERIEVTGSTDIYGNWLRTSGNFRLTDKRNRLELTVSGKNITADNLLIRPIGTDVYYYSSQKLLVKNNIPLKLNSAK